MTQCGVTGTFRGPHPMYSIRGTTRSCERPEDEEPCSASSLGRASPELPPIHPEEVKHVLGRDLFVTSSPSRTLCPSEYTHYAHLRVKFWTTESIMIARVLHLLRNLHNKALHWITTHMLSPQMHIQSDHRAPYRCPACGFGCSPPPTHHLRSRVADSENFGEW